MSMYAATVNDWCRVQTHVYVCMYVHMYMIRGPGTNRIATYLRGHIEYSYISKRMPWHL